MAGITVLLACIASLAQPWVATAGEPPAASNHSRVVEEAAGGAPVTRTAPPNDDFIAAAPIVGRAGQVRGSNVGASSEVWEPDPLQEGSASVWWSWTAPANGIVRFDTRGSDVDTVLGIYTGDDVGSLETVAVNDDSGHPTASSVVFDAVGGTTYHVQVDGVAGAVGEIRLGWRPHRPSGPSNDDLAQASTIRGVSGSVTGTTKGATAEYGEPTLGDELSHSVWWAWTAPAAGPYTFSVEGDGLEPIVAVHRGTDPEWLTEESMSHSGGSVLASTSFEALKGETYAIQVDGRDGASGDVTLAWEPTTTSLAVPQAAAFTTIPASADTGEKPQSKAWQHDGKWYVVLPSTAVSPAGTWLWRLDADGWRNVLHLDPATNAKADVKRVGAVAHIALRVGSGSARLVSIENRNGTYERWTVRTTTTPIALTNSETITIDIDTTGRMWLATDAAGAVHVHHSAYPYTSFSSPITLATGIASDDIALVTALPGGRIGVLWSNQKTQRFGFRLRQDNGAVGTWSPDEVPASQSALQRGGGMADDHLNVAVASDGTLFAAVKTSYDSSGFVTIGLLVRRPNGTWDPLHTVDTSGTRPTVVVNEGLGVVDVLYNSSTGYHDIRRKRSGMGTIAFGDRIVAMAGAFRDVTSTKDNWTGEVVFLASTTDAVAHHRLLTGPSEPPTPTLTAQSGTLTVAAGSSAAGVLTASYDGTRHLTYSIRTAPTKGAVQVTDPGTGAFLYDAAAGQVGSDSFRFRVSDGTLTSEADVSVTILAGGSDPGAPPDGAALGWWALDEGAGTVARDGSGWGNHGMFVGSPTWVDGRFGSALRMDSGRFVVVPDSSSLDVRGVMTIATWVRPERVRTQYLVHKVGSGAGYELSLASDGRPFVRFNDKARVNAVSVHPSDGQTWMHLAATYDGSMIRLYVDGVLEGSGPGPTGGIRGTTADLGLGAAAGGTNPLRGAMDEVWVVGRAMTSQEITALAGR